MIYFRWDPAKAQRNLRKHGVSFTLTRQVFEDPFALVQQDRIENHEVRWVAIGRAARDTVLVVAHTVSEAGVDEVIRIISARRALRHERARYEEQAY